MGGKFAAITVSRKTGEESIFRHGLSGDNNLLGFWQWAFSDLASNSLRGVLAEYLVACALNLDLGTRREWDAYDLVTNDGLKLEIKSAAYLQTWEQKRPSNIIFRIPPTLGWDASTNLTATEKRRHADIYIFCVLNHRDKLTLNPLDLDQWTVYLLSTKTLDAKLPTQKTISLSALLKLNPVQTSFEDLAESIGRVQMDYDL